MSGIEPGRTALFSARRLYRYTLVIPLLRLASLLFEAALRVGDGLDIAVIMVNPSTADIDKNDHTIRKLIGFGWRHGWRRITVGNLFAYKATDIADLRRARRPVGVLNNANLRKIISEAGLVIVAWGRLDKMPQAYRERYKVVIQLAEELGVPLYCFGTNADGMPVHPLNIGYASQISQWEYHTLV